MLGWRPPHRYDTVFFAFFLSHVPPSRLGDFWSTVAAALAPNGKVVFIDEGPAAAAREEVAADVRRLDDGSRYRIVKVLHEPGELAGELAALGWSADIRPQEEFIIGIAEPRSVPVTQCCDRERSPGQLDQPDRAASHLHEVWRGRPSSSPRPVHQRSTWVGSPGGAAGKSRLSTAALSGAGGSQSTDSPCVMS